MNDYTNTKTLPASMVVPKFIKNLIKLTNIFPSFITLKIANKLFTTPVKFSVPEREKALQRSAEQQRVLVTSLEKEIDVLTYGYSPKKVLLVHGWSGRATQFFMAADRLLEKRYMVVSFDALAHGNSEGKQTNFLDFIAIVKQLNTDFGPFESAIGHSLGGMVLYNCQNELQLKNMITIGAGNTITEIISRFIHTMHFKKSIARQLKQFYDNKFQIDVDDFSSENKARQCKIPTLVVHDSQDGDVAVSCAYAIRQNLQNGTLLITKGLGHTKILRDKKTMFRIVDFIIENS